MLESVESALSSPTSHAKDFPQIPEGVYVVGKAVKLIAATPESRTGPIDTAFFRNASDAQAYLAENYPGYGEVKDITYLALDSLQPAMPDKQCQLSEVNLWSTTPPVADSPKEFTQIATVFEDRNPPQARDHQVSPKSQVAIGVWANPDEAIAYYTTAKPDKRIRDNGILGQGWAPSNPLKRNELYVQRKTVVNPVTK